MEKSFKYTSIEFLYIIILLLFVGRPATFFVVNDPRTNPIGFLLYLFPSLYLFYSHGIKINKKFLALLGIYTIWAAIHTTIDYDVKILNYLLCYVHFFVAYVVVQVYHTEIFGYFWRIATALTFLDCILWAGIHFVDLETLSNISLLTPTSDTSSASFIIFNSPGLRYEGLGIMGLLRNCGFAWEPGLYGSILIIAVFFNLAENDYKLQGNYAFMILAFGIFTTFSTTAYSALIILFALHVIYSSLNEVTPRRVWGLAALVCLALLVNNLPFMNEKIQDDVNMEGSFVNDSQAITLVDKDRELRTLQRTEGLVLDYINFMDAPIMGYGLARDNSYMFREISQYITTSNDLTSFLARWGIILTILIVGFMIWSSIFLRRYILMDSNSIFLLYIVIAISYSLTFCALIIAFLLYPVFETYIWEDVANSEDFDGSTEDLTITSHT